MAAKALVAPNLVWQKVTAALANANPGIQQQFKALKSYLAQTTNPDLQFLAFTDAQVTTDTGTQLATGAGRLYGFYVKKSGTAGTGTATDSFVGIVDSATVNTSFASLLLAELVLLNINDERAFTDPVGVVVANGWNISAGTTTTLTTESTAGDAGPGFIIIG